VGRASDDSQREIARVQALARDLSPRDGVLIYPEGTRFSEGKRARVLERLAREGDLKALEYARSLHSLLPPRPGGALALLEAAPHADVVVRAHTGFEGAATLAQIWRGDLLHQTIRVRFQRIPRASIPTGRDAQAQWLRERLAGNRRLAGDPAGALRSGWRHARGQQDSNPVRRPNKVPLTKP
jgi:hypothetical protein